MAQKDKTGQSYENLVQVIFQSIVLQRDYPNLSVERNVILQGKTTSHQIDIYWKFEVGGVQYETIVQAKDWNKPVDKSHLLLFKSILDDLRGQPKGVFVTRSGYQAGAKEFALAHGILLYELREVEEGPPVALTVGGWAKIGLVRMPLHGAVKCVGEELNIENTYALGFVWDVCTPQFSGMKFDVSQSWLKQKYPETDLNDVKRVDFAPTPLNEISLYNQDGVAVGNLHELFLRMGEAMKEESVDQKWISHAFTEPTFIRVASLDIPQLKVDAVSMNIEIQHSHHTRRGKMSNFAQLVLHQLNSDQKLWFAATPSVLPRSDESN
jgi:Restriction endonuclease